MERGGRGGRLGGLKGERPCGGGGEACPELEIRGFQRVEARELWGVKGICDEEKEKERPVRKAGRGVPTLKKAFELPMLRRWAC